MSIATDIFRKHVRGTIKKAIVQLVHVFLCHIPNSVIKGIGTTCKKIYITTRVIKHVYDKRPAEEFDFCLENLCTAVKYPDKVFKNKTGKRGSYCFVKEIKNQKIFASLETIENELESPQLVVVTFYRVDDSYLNGYELLWEWKDGTPSS